MTLLSPLDILFISFNMPWRGGGTFYRVFGFAQHLVRLGHRVTILATSPDESLWLSAEAIAGVRLVLSPAVLRGSLRTGWDPTEVVRRCRWLARQRFDLIHGFESRPVVIYPALYARRRYGVPLVLDWCDWFGRGGSVEQRGRLTRLLLRPIETYYEERFRRRAAGATVINTLLRRRALDLGVPAEFIHWLPNGADTNNIRVLERDEARRSLGLDAQAALIGHLGQAFPGDAALLAAAFVQVHAACPASRLLLIGNHKTDIAAYLDHGPAVLETGYVDTDHMNRYLAACDLLWLPLQDTLANRGRWPMKINDYLCAGRPIVSTAVGDLADWFRGPHPVGVLAAGTPVAFARQTLDLLADPEACRRYGRSGRYLAETTLAWPLVTAGLEQFYHRLLAATP